MTNNITSAARDADTARYDGAVLLLPDKLRGAARTLTRDERASAEEIRLRIGRPITVVTSRGECAVHGETVTKRDLDGLLDIATGASAHAARDSVRAGYITVRGGYRIGLCGTAVAQSGEITGFRALSSASVRIPHEARGVAGDIAPQLMRGGRVRSTLIISPPGGGKTTLLRDLIREVSDGDRALGLAPSRVALADERSEIAALLDGAPQMEVGRNTDVLDACPKAAAVLMLLRAMNPQVIALDEITAPEDVDALTRAANCGVSLIATAHADSLDDLRRRAIYRPLLELGVFEKLVRIYRQGEERRYTVSDLAACPVN
ncbi:MAG: Flp pilus assembly complex ATPase component TadA [Oscillospiraceae bacterium]|jgi:stage III sporulation protein AA|nr:Flp pilus assembly complex ATPase component TadA [Oscillospiraceae bacterium]